MSTVCLRRVRVLEAACAAALVAIGLASTATAAPYASAVSESAGVVSFTLNQGAANVTVIRDGVPEVMGALAQGAHTFNRNGAANYSIVATNTEGSGFTTATGKDPTSGALIGTPIQLSDDNNPRMSYFAPRGLVVNQNPANGALFGRIYVSNSTAGTTGGFPTPVRSVGRGIYVLNPDQTDALGQGDTALTGGITFAANGFSPYRLALDKDGSLYVSDQSDANGSVYRMDANVTTGANLLVGLGGAAGVVPSSTQNHGSVAALSLTGASSTSDLVLRTIDEDMSPDGMATQLNSEWRYDVGATTSGYNGIPVQGVHPLISNFAPGGIIVDLSRGPDGKLYMSQNRTDGSEVGVVVVSPDGQTVLYNSLSDTIAKGLDGNPAVAGQQDIFRTTIGQDVSPDGKWLAIVRADSTVTMVPLINGIPDMLNRIGVATMDPIANGREIAFDAAGNLYEVSSGNQAMRIFSPGILSQTVFNSNGTFSYKYNPEWNVTAGGNYSASGNWLLGVVPNGTGATAIFGTASTGAANVNLDVPVTLANLYFDGTNKYTISGAALTMDSFGEPRIQTYAGNHEIASAVIVNENLQVTTNTGSSLKISNGLTYAGTATTLTKAGGGSFILAGGTNYTGNTLVQDGTLQLNGSSSWGPALNGPGTTNITGRAVIFDYNDASPDPATDIEAKLTASFGTGFTDATKQLYSSTANSSIGLGWKDDTAAKQVTVARTLFGDANLDLSVDTVDFNLLAANFGGSGKNWAQGDFNYDDSVDTVDFNLLAANFSKTLSGDASGAAASSALGALVPEPTSLGLLAFAACGLTARRRR